MKLKSTVKDILNIYQAIKSRKDKYISASDEEIIEDKSYKISKNLHSGKIEVRVLSVKEIAPFTKTFIFTADKLPLFKPGQFMTLEAKINETITSRPYSISSSPMDTLLNPPTITLTIQRFGFFGTYIYDNLKENDTILAEIGLGDFFYEELRDSKKVLAIAQGGAITPFLSMARSVKNKSLDINLTILYAVKNKADIILKDELEECLCSKVKVIYVSENLFDEEVEHGLVTSELIQKYSSEETSYFVCGNLDMYTYIQEQLDKLNVKKKYIRYAAAGQVSDISKCENYPTKIKDSVFNITVKQGISERIIKAKANESIAVSLERAGIKLHTVCRSGICGCCQIKIEEGNYFINSKYDNRRKADLDFNYVYACSTYPLSDLKIRININC